MGNQVSANKRSQLATSQDVKSLLVVQSDNHDLATNRWTISSACRWTHNSSRTSRMGRNARDGEQSCRGIANYALFGAFCDPTQPIPTDPGPFNPTFCSFATKCVPHTAITAMPVYGFIYTQYPMRQFPLESILGFLE